MRAAHLGQTRTVYTVPGSVPHDGVTAFGSAFNTWLATVPNHSEVRFLSSGNYAFNDSIYYAGGPNGFYGGALSGNGRTDVVFNGNGCTFTALTAGTPSRNLFAFSLSTGCRLENCTMVGPLNNGGITPPGGTNFEFQSGIALIGATGFTATGVTIKNCYGYFVFCADSSGNGTGGTPTNIVVDSCSFLTNGSVNGFVSQGLALVCVDGFTLSNSTMTGVTANAVDLEPNFTGQPCRNVNVHNNTLGYHISAVSTGGATTPSNCSNFTFDTNICQMDQWTCNSDVYLHPRTGGITGCAITNNQFNFITSPQQGTANMNISVDGFPGIIVKGNTCKQVQPGTCSSPSAYIYISNSSGFDCENNTGVIGANGAPTNGVYGTGNGTWTVANNSNFPANNIT